MQSPTHPQKVYLPEETTVTKKNNRRRRKNRAGQSQEVTVNMINTLRSEYDHLLAPPFLAKKDDSGVPTMSVLLGKESSTTPSTTLDQVST
jgi:hypothetical protein